MFVCAECGASQPVDGRCIADGSPLTPRGDDMLLGQSIGAYRIARLLGVGGMGRVYKGVHPQIGSRVAIKVLSRECSDRRDLVDRFFSEAKAVNLIRHESIVNVLDLSTLPDGRPYIVMEYLDGSPLASIIEQAQIQRTAVPLGGLARLIAEVLDALGAAHAKGIVHRDLKPDNIYVTPSGRPKVLDFGIAKLQPELGGSATQSGSLLGTPHYMSPEQAAGRPVDLRADIYALGVILFECATLLKPFTADSLFDLLRKHIEAPPPSPRALRHDMPESLEHVIYTALAKFPDQRFASAQAMSMALQHATSQLPGDQWAPILPPSSRTPSQNWAPTPPQSWANRPTIPNQSTATAGQVVAPSRTGSRKGLWIALGAIGVVGAGVAIAVIASSGGESSQTAAAPPGSAVAVTPTAPAGSAEAPQAEAEEPDEPDEPDVPAPPTTPSINESMITPQVDDAVGTMIEQMPPEARKVLPVAVKAALAKYGSWKKIPAAERKKLAAKIASGDMDLSAVTADINSALSPTTKPATKPVAPTAPVASDPRDGLGPDGWIVSRRFKPPGKFDPKQLDAQKYLPFALSEAKKLIPDAVLFRIDANGVLPNGRADITAVDNGSLDYRFISPSRMKRDPSKPLGAKHEWKCMFRIMIDEEGAWSAPINGWECKEKLTGPPKCSFTQVWNKALAKGAPSNALGSLGFRESRWYFSIDGTSFSEMFKDDC